MAKVTNPLLSGEVRGAFGKKMIFRKGGVVTRMFSPKNPRSAAQQAHRTAFKEYYMASLTQAQADLLYAAIIHQHDDLYSLLGHGHDHGGLSGLDDDDHAQYLNQSRGDARYPLFSHGHQNGGADGASVDHDSLLNAGTKTHAQIDTFLNASVPAWTAPTLVNSWVNYGGAYAPAGYWKDGAGIVHLRGLVKNGSAIPTTIFTLPVGYRPLYTFEVLVDSKASVGICVINTNGTVVAAAGYTNYFSLDGLLVFT